MLPRFYIAHNTADSHSRWDLHDRQHGDNSFFGHIEFLDRAQVIVDLLNAREGEKNDARKRRSELHSSVR